MRAPDTSEVADLVGTPFAYGGRGPDTFDCYGLVRELHRRQGVLLPDYRSPSDRPHISALMMNQLQLWEPTSPEPGAVVVIKILGRIAHCGIVLPADRFIHTWEGSGGVVVERLADWSQRIHDYYRYVGNR
jgi:cell wall-associated NlpC family hydrolase